jgi:hypothetical protein
MGVYVLLEIIPEDISPDEWADVYRESLELLKSYQGGLMGRAKKQIGSTEVLVHSRELEHEKQDPEKRKWHVVGDFASKQTGESFILYYDLHHYGKRRNQKPLEGDDILFHTRDSDNDSDSHSNSDSGRKTVSVFDSKTQGCPYHIPILAAAMLIEDRFPQYALVSGNINLAQAEEAGNWAQSVLKRKIALPIRVQGKALFQRLARFRQGDALIKAFNLLFIGTSEEQYAVIFELADKALVKRWFLHELKDCKSPSQIGAIELYINWLNATDATDGALKTLCEMACLDAEGPKFDPVEFARGLAGTWVTIEQSSFEFLGIFSHKEDEIETPYTQFGQFFLDAGLTGRKIRCHISHDRVMSILSNLFPEQAAQMEQALRSRVDSIRQDLSEMRGPAEKFIQKVEEEPKEEGEEGLESEVEIVDNLIYFDPTQPLSDSKRFILRAFAYGICEFRKKINQLGEDALMVYEGPSELLVERIARACSRQGIVLTEDAWEWIICEKDKTMLQFLITLTLINNNELKFSTMRKATLENRDLAQEIMRISEDEKELSEIADMVKQIEDHEKHKS